MSEKQPLPDAGEDIALENLGSDRKGSVLTVKDGMLVNVSGHRDQLQRHYGLWSICSLVCRLRLLPCH